MIKKKFSRHPIFSAGSRVAGKKFKASDIINPNDEGKLWAIFMWPGSGYLLNTTLVRADDYYDAISRALVYEYNQGNYALVQDDIMLDEELREYYKDELANMSEDEQYEFLDNIIRENYISGEGMVSGGEGADTLYTRAENFSFEEVPEENIIYDTVSSFRRSVRAGCGKWKHIKEYYEKKKKAKKKVKSQRMTLSSSKDPLACSEPEKINGGNWRPGDPREGYIVRYDLSDRFGWLCAHTCKTLDEAKRFIKENNLHII